MTITSAQSTNPPSPSPRYSLKLFPSTNKKNTHPSPYEVEPTLRGEEIDPRPADSGWLWLWSCFVSCSYLPLFFVVVSRKVAFAKDWKIDGNILESNKWGFLMNNKTPQVQWETKWSLASFLFILCVESTYLYEKILANCAFNESNISEACFKPKKKPPGDLALDLRVLMLGKK